MKKWIVMLLILFSLLPQHIYSDSKGFTPSNLNIQYHDSTVTLNWGSIPSVEMYYVYVKDDPYGISALVDSTTMNSWSGNYIKYRNFFEIRAKIPPPPEGFVFVKGGTFEMGDHLDGDEDSLPVHAVIIGDFYMGATEITQAEWSQYMPVSTYDHGAGDYYPVYYVSWYQTIKYCNLRSISEGLTPCYNISGYTDPAYWGEVPTYFNTIWRTAVCDWRADGYRLPTEAEWEYAARGELSSKRFPRGFTISHSTNADEQANYYSYLAPSPYYPFDISPSGGHHPDYGASAAPVGSFPPNGFGLYDMSGNVEEWCWDGHDSNYYSTCDSLGTVIDPSESGPYYNRILRGGSWYWVAAMCAVSNRHSVDAIYSYDPDYPDGYYGFRVARGSSEFTNGLMATLRSTSSGGGYQFNAKRNVECSRQVYPGSEVYTFTAQTYNNETLTVKFSWDTNETDSIVFISDSEYNEIRVQSTLLNLYIDSASEKADETYIKVLEVEAGTIIKAEVEGFIYQTGYPTVPYIFEDGYLITKNFVLSNK